MVEQSIQNFAPQTFAAPTMREALAKVRETLGPDAIILHTRQQPTRGLFTQKSPGVEVIASKGDMPTTDRSPEPASAATATEQSRESIEQTVRRLQARVEALTGAARFDQGDGHRSPMAPASVLEESLLRSEMPMGLVRECVEVARHERLAEMEPTTPAVKVCLANYLSARIRTEPLFDSQTQAVALVGSSGVGKTSMIAKLAAWLIEAGDRPVAIASTDGYRIGSADEIRRYAEILGVPWIMVKSPAALAEYLERQPIENIVLIDTPGRSPADVAGIDELRRWMIGRIRPAIVIAANQRDSAVQAALDAFSVLEYERLLLTKLDETPGTGAIAGIAARAPVPISFLSIGQEIREDLEPADAIRLARWLLGDSAGTSAPLKGAKGPASAMPTLRRRSA